MIKRLLDILYYRFEVFSNHIPFFAYLYILFHTPSVKKEIDMAGLKNKDKILHIGCGAIPYTSIILADQLDVSIVGIDIHKGVVEKALFFLKKLDKENKIEIKIGDGSNYDVSLFDAIIISFGIKRQDLVLKHVFNSIEKGKKIILRRPTTDKNRYIENIIEKYSEKSINSLLTQDSILILKNHT